jgi:transposase
MKAAVWRPKAMAGFRKPEQSREQLVLFSARLDDCLPPDHPVRLVAHLLESAAFAPTFADWANDYVLVEGKPPYHPRDLTGLYIYGMMNRIRSSRQLEAACHNRVDVRWLMSGQTPDHSTIADFVGRHGKRLRGMFQEVLALAHRAGLVKLEHVSVDGTKIEANAGRGSVQGELSIAGELAGVREQIEALEKEWQANELREARLFGNEVPWAPGGGGSMKDRLARMKAKQSRLEDALAAIIRRREASTGWQDPKAIASTTDPDGRVMKDKEGRSKPNYNAQAGVDTTEGVIVANEVNDHPEDSGLLAPAMVQIEENCGQLPTEVSADSQYNVGPDLERLEQMGVVGYLPANRSSSEVSKPDAARQAVAAAQADQRLTDEQWNALPKDKDKRITKEAFRYDPAADVYRCPMGQSLGFLRYSQNKNASGVVRRAQYGGCAACAGCPRANGCCGHPAQGRTINRDQYEACRERMRARFHSEQGRSRYRLRGPTVEPRFGHIKSGLGIRRFMRRGLEAVRTEWSMICTVVNMGILLRHWAQVAAVL